MAELVKGAPAPDFRLTAADGSTVSLADFAGRKLILYFYPAALTPGCTIEAADFAAAEPTLQAAGYTVVGISPDDPATLTTFATANNLSFTLLSDPDHTALNAYGAWGERKLWGKTFIGVIRSTFVIKVDPHGKALVLDAQYGVRATGHVKRLEASLGIIPTAQQLTQ
ncbi:MAG: peroxiredoxin [Propionibacteriaceae bacterium]|jgi:peroxiredoxin Q/BCP|nr:peroxiredoxin [Propionibacteriaceae bacterium]